MTEKSPIHEQSATFPTQILFEKWADIGFFWQGELPLSALPRLSEHLDMTAQEKNCPALSVQVRLEKKDVVWLSFELEGTLWLSCHRCLGEMGQDIAGRYEMAVITHESQLVYAEEADYAWLSELGDGRMLPVRDVLEDELILALPLSNTHDDCDMLVESAGELVETPKENPFAALAALKDSLASNKS